MDELRGDFFERGEFGIFGQNNYAIRHTNDFVGQLHNVLLRVRFGLAMRVELAQPVLEWTQTTDCLCQQFKGGLVDVARRQFGHVLLGKFQE